MRSRHTGLMAVVLMLAALVLLVAACGDDDSGDDGGGGAAATQPATTTGDGDSAPAAEETQSVEMLLSFPESIAWVPLLVARGNGYFEEEGLEIETQATDGSGFVTQQVIAGNAEYGWAGGDSIIVAASQDPDLRAVACNAEQNIFRIITLADNEDVQSFEDVAGKTLGITEKGGGEEPLVNSALADSGLTDEVEVLPIGVAGPAAVRAIEDGEVDAYATSFPDVATLVASGLEVRDITPEKFSRTPGDCLVVKKATLEDPEKLEIVSKIARSVQRGAEFTIDDPEAALEVSCPSVPEECSNEAFANELMNQMVQLMQPLDDSVPLAGLDVEGWKTTADILLETGTIKEPVDVDQLVDSPEVREVWNMVEQG